MLRRAPALRHAGVVFITDFHFRLDPNSGVHRLA